MSEEKASLELLGARVLTLTVEVRAKCATCNIASRRWRAEFSALEARLGAMEARLGALEQRFAVQEDRISAMLGLIVRIADRVERRPDPSSE